MVLVPEIQTQRNTRGGKYGTPVPRPSTTESKRTVGNSLEVEDKDDREERWSISSYPTYLRPLRLRPDQDIRHNHYPSPVGDPKPR